MAVLVVTSAIIGCTKLPPPTISVVEKPRDLVVFDIDGTLTPEVNDSLEVRADAADVAREYAKRGYEVLYLTARRTYLQRHIPAWLRQHGFPEGDLQTAQSRQDNLDPEAFKVRVLEQYKRAGWHLKYAYGDSSTDFTAYAKVGIEKSHVFALRRRDATTCQPGQFRVCLNDFTAHLPFLNASVPLTRAAAGKP